LQPSKSPHSTGFLPRATGIPSAGQIRPPDAGPLA
jgi:hypothetical protein